MTSHGSLDAILAVTWSDWGELWNTCQDSWMGWKLATSWMLQLCYHYHCVKLVKCDWYDFMIHLYVLINELKIMDVHECRSCTLQFSIIIKLLFCPPVCWKIWNVVSYFYDRKYTTKINCLFLWWLYTIGTTLNSMNTDEPVTMKWP